MVTNTKTNSNLAKKWQLLKTAVSSCFTSKSTNRHWFEVRYIYNKNGFKQFDFVSQVGLVSLDTTLDRRQLKKITTPLHKIPKVKKMLCNGQFDVEIICYLGRFSK
jgi:hypothetical protein